MGSYQEEQLRLIKRIEEGFKNGQSPSTIVEPVDDYTKDNRICLTLVTFLPSNLENGIIKKLIIPLQNADQRHYFYVPTSFHITIQNVRTIAQPPLFNNADIEKVKAVLERTIPQFSSLEFNLKRIFQLPTSLSICAFTDKSLGNLALRIREELVKEGVSDNKQYANREVVFANTTFCRYQTEPNEEFKKLVNELKDVKIGEFEAKDVSLITTNCVCLPEMTKILSSNIL